MNFLVTVACVAGFAACPLPKPFTSTMAAKNTHECHKLVEGLIAAYNYPAKDFHVKCEPK